MSFFRPPSFPRAVEFEFHHDTRVRRGEALAWLTDITEDDHHGARWRDGDRVWEASRRVVARTERFVELEDEWRWGRTLHAQVAIDPAGNAWHIRGRTKGARWETTHVIEDLPDGGCRIRTRYVMEGVGLGKLLLPLLRRSLVRAIREDMDLHVADMEEQLGYASP